MIFWSRWGIIVVAFIVVGVALGFAIMSLLGASVSSDARFGLSVGTGFLLSAALLWLFNLKILGTYIDKRVPAVIVEKLAEPFTLPNGVVQRTRTIPILHPETGQQLMTNPVSTFFFAPLKYWPFILGLLGMVIVVLSAVTLVNGSR